MHILFSNERRWPMELSGKKVIIPVEEMFNTHEFWYPYYRLKEAGCEVVVTLRLRWT
jgi:hypothetical protein